MIKANLGALIRGKHFNLKPQLGTAVASLLHIKARRKGSLTPTFLFIQFGGVG